MDRLPPVTPGELLDQEFLQPLGVSQYRLAKAIGVPASRISEIISGQRVITADTDLRLCRYLGLSPGYWLRAQAAHDTELACAEMGEVLAGIQPLVHGCGQRRGWPGNRETGEGSAASHRLTAPHRLIQTGLGVSLCIDQNPTRAVCSSSRENWPEEEFQPVHPIPFRYSAAPSSTSR
jgi:hypothetical protein